MLEANTDQSTRSVSIETEISSQLMKQVDMLEERNAMLEKEVEKGQT